MQGRILEDKSDKNLKNQQSKHFSFSASFNYRRARPGADNRDRRSNKSGSIIL